MADGTDRLEVIVHERNAGKGAAVLTGTGAAAAQAAWPARPLRMIVGFAPGGPTDIVARVIAARLSEQLGVGVLIENKPGAGGNLAADLAAKAPADGYTLFYNTSAITIAPSLYGKVPYDTLRDFVPVTTTATNAMIVMVHPSMPVKSIGELVAYARSNQGKLNYASSGTGTITHLATAALAAQLGLTMTHVPYKGRAPARVDTAAGVVNDGIERSPRVRSFSHTGPCVGATSACSPCSRIRGSRPSSRIRRVMLARAAR
jgi:tripartite-type tricarboxylate transporter receptor subunit TctC